TSDWSANWGLAGAGKLCIRSYRRTRGRSKRRRRNTLNTLYHEYDTHIKHPRITSWSRRRK
ncbi:unnamed protein product, partial [Nesidiocoris tenuis]